MLLFLPALVVLFSNGVGAGDPRRSFLESDKTPISISKYIFEDNYADFSLNKYSSYNDGNCNIYHEKLVDFSASDRSTKSRQGPGKPDLLEYEFKTLNLDLMESNTIWCFDGTSSQTSTYYFGSVPFSGLPKDFMKNGVAFDFTFDEFCGIQISFPPDDENKYECVQNVAGQVVLTPVTSSTRNHCNDKSSYIRDTQFYSIKRKYSGIQSEAEIFIFSLDAVFSLFTEDFFDFDCDGGEDEEYYDCDSLCYLGKSENDLSFKTIVRKPISKPNHQE